MLAALTLTILDENDKGEVRRRVGNDL